MNAQAMEPLKTQPKRVPSHLKKYVIDQSQRAYTAEDQALWRYVMRQLRDFLRTHAHPCYIHGLAKTGIEVEQIPSIEKMNEKLSEFGWGAVPVSGFIPPAAFMEFQSLGFLPIASDIRSLDHILYTPAPDIIHEAAGHAPILIDSEFSSYLRAYAEVASHAILSSEDFALYKAIRELSDVKENPDSTPVEVDKAEASLKSAIAGLTFVSEGAQLGRMNWWTAEYGLIGDIENPKLFGAGLLSSLGEARSCLEPKVKKIPISVDCIRWSYDITEKQPQLFVAQSFQSLKIILDQFAATMSFRQGGNLGLQRAMEAKTINTVQFNSGIQISGQLSEVLWSTSQNDEVKQPIYLRFQGPCQLSVGRKELNGHSKSYHAQGYGTPIGRIRGHSKCLSEMTAQELSPIGLNIGSKVELTYDSGVQVSGVLRNRTEKGGSLILLSFDQCTVKLREKILFEPEWGVFDLAVGAWVPSVFGGPADRLAFGEQDDFEVARVPTRKHSEKDIERFTFYQRIRDLRCEQIPKTTQFEKLVDEYFASFSSEWLMGIEIVEIGIQNFSTHPKTKLMKSHLESQFNESDVTQYCVSHGLRLASIN